MADLFYPEIIPFHNHPSNREDLFEIYSRKTNIYYQLFISHDISRIMDKFDDIWS